MGLCRIGSFRTEVDEKECLASILAILVEVQCSSVGVVGSGKIEALKMPPLSDLLINGQESCEGNERI
jgi:hypothetical protein